MATDTSFEDGNLVTEGPDGDVELELGARRLPLQLRRPHHVLEHVLGLGRGAPEPLDVAAAPAREVAG